MDKPNLQRYFFLVFLIASLILTLVMFGDLLLLLAFGGVLAVAVRPLHRWLVRLLRSDFAASFITIVIAAAAVLVPMGIFVAALYVEAAQMITDAGTQIAQGVPAAWLIQVVPAPYLAQVTELLSDSQAILKAVAGYLATNLPGIFSNAMEAALGFFIILFSTYYLLRDSKKLKKTIVDLSPLGDEDDESVINKVVGTVGAVINGVVIIGIVKAVLATLFLWVFGVPQPFFWGAMTGLSSVLPMIGTGLVLGPAVLYLVVTGHLAAALGLAAVSVGLVGTVDNFLQPKLVESKTNIHPLLVLLSVIGGIKFYGFSGFVLGPLTVAVSLGLLDIYKKKFRSED